MTLLARDRMQRQWWPSKGHKIIWRKLLELCFAFKLDQFIKLPSKPVFSIWFAKAGEKVDILGCVGIPHIWHWLWPVYDTLYRWLLCPDDCFWKVAVAFPWKVEQLGVQRGYGKMTSWEVNKPHSCLVTLSMYNNTKKCMNKLKFKIHNFFLLSLEKNFIAQLLNNYYYLQLHHCHRCHRCHSCQAVIVIIIVIVIIVVIAVIVVFAVIIITVVHGVIVTSLSSLKSSISNPHHF